jgi:chemotaxis protein CheX
MVSRLLGVEMDSLDATISDALGEMVNIVAGGAKAKFSNENGGPPIDLSLPNVIQGSNYCVDYPSHTTWLDVPFSSELGAFNLRVTFQLDKKGE